jgi:hypothetical protein
MTYDELPQEIRSIIPRNKFGAARKVNAKLILVQPHYDNNWDRYRLVDGKWEYVNPGTILK